MSACTEPGCGGQIVDGYCDTCGMPPTTGGSTSAAAEPEAQGAPAASGPAKASDPAKASRPPRRPAAPRPAPTASGVPQGTPCAMPGCGGHVVDGYCDVCGTPPGAVPAAVDDAATGAMTRPTSPSRLASTALGSQRAGSTLSSSTRRVRAGSQRVRQARLGAGLTTIPPTPAIDPSTVVMKNPVVPEDKRNCPQCGNPVGRAQGEKKGREEGFCPKCGSPFSFTPKLRAGDLVAGQYLVEGALAHGGLGWIYLAKDRNVSDRWVVLKGLLNSGDKDALAAAIAEQRFLAQVEHPLIVEIYNFVTHDDAGYIVMEYIGGKSLKELLKERMRAHGGVYDPLPVDQALAYIIEILPAFQYLHDLGLVYCDFKPDNLIQVGDSLKLIDLGGVRHVDDQESAIYGTVGYQAPEVAELGPTVASDVWTIGRSLVVLCMEFRGYQTTYVKSLPDPETTPLFQQYDNLYRLIAKCCALDPADRFASVDELKGQALGVLREVVARDTTGTALTSAASVNFLSPTTASADLDWASLPELRPDPHDSQYTWLTSLAPGTPDERLAQLGAAPDTSAEVWIARAMEGLRQGRLDLTQQAAAEMLKEDPWEWRAVWLQGLAALQSGDAATAQAAFNAVYQQVPGELAPKLALALACEKGGVGDVAERLYAVCAGTDAAYVAPAAFGMARVRAARGDTSAAVAALDLVPATSRGYGQSRRLRAEVLVSGSKDDLAVLDQAMGSVAQVRLDPAERHALTATILERALATVLSSPKSAKGKAAATGALASGLPTSEPAVRLALESTYRALGRESSTDAERIAWVNKANAVRPWSRT